jgi:tetratricopeptide (TPR) repeat protein
MPNDQMLAHYLLGRCYADMHEAPMALHCYQEAISRADTTAKDCDFAQLSRVYGQSATIFYQQGLYRNQLEYQDLASSYAWRGNDTLATLQCYAIKALAYNQLQMKDSAIYVYTDAIKQLKANKYNKVAAH